MIKEKNLTYFNEFLFEIPKIENPNIRIIMIMPTNFMSSRKNLENVDEKDKNRPMSKIVENLPTMGANFFDSYNVRFIKPMDKSEYDKIEKDET